jgi:hypothetical protein
MVAVVPALLLLTSCVPLSAADVDVLSNMMYSRCMALTGEGRQIQPYEAQPGAAVSTCRAYAACMCALDMELQMLLCKRARTMCAQ